MTKKKKKKKMCGELDAFPCCREENMDLKPIVLSTRLRSSMQIIDKNICSTQQVVNTKNDWLFPSTMVLFSQLSILICSYE